MRIPSYTKQFRKDYKKILKTNKNINLLDLVMQKLVNNEKLEEHYNDHVLHGNWKNCRDCHIQGDWLLIYKLIKTSEICFMRTGSHADLFK